jgi:uncharacterized protein (DUF58 family)
MNLIRTLYLQKFFYAWLAADVLMFVLSASFSALFFPAQILFALVIALLLVDIAMLYVRANAVFASRHIPERLSNGDENPVELVIENQYAFPIKVKVVDEIPVQFQKRDLAFLDSIKSGESSRMKYWLTPVRRGEYTFGSLNIFVTAIIGFAARKYVFEKDVTVPVYPSFLQMRKFELLAISNNLSDYGIKQIRKIGHSMEFEKIREYVKGDDYRTINWKATARKNNLMVNQYQDERSQHVYSLIDKGRLMKSPFEEMTLLDYAINAALVISNIAIKKGDKSGLITFSEKVNTLLAADSRGTQMQKIQEALYREQTNFLDSNFEMLNALISRKLSQRSLLLLYTNFESQQSMRRQLKYIKAIAARHLVVVIFFENTELKKMLSITPTTTEEIYQKAIAEKFVFEKRLIARELKASGIQCVLTTPQKLTVDTINKYLELKMREMV